MKLGISRLKNLHTHVKHPLANVRKGILLFLVTFVVLFVPRQSLSVEPLTAIAAGAALTATVISLFDTGANPVATATLQNRQMLKSIHARLDNYDKIFQVIFKKLDALPDRIQRRLLQGFDIAQMRQVRGVINNIISDVDQYQKLRANDPNTTATPSSDLSERMGILQHAAAVLLTHNSDFIFFDALAAKYVEVAIISMQTGYESEELAIVIDNRQELYHKRFREMLIPWLEMTQRNGKMKYESLLESLKHAESSLSENVDNIDFIIARDEDYLAAYYSSSDNCGLWECCGTCTINYGLLPAKVDERKSEFDQSLEQIAYLEIAIPMYQNMLSAIKLELGHFDEATEFKQPTHLATDYSAIRLDLSLFQELDSHHSHPGECPHC